VEGLHELGWDARESFKVGKSRRVIERSCVIWGSFRGWRGAGATPFPPGGGRSGQLGNVDVVCIKIALMELATGGRTAADIVASKRERSGCTGSSLGHFSFGSFAGDPLEARPFPALRNNPEKHKPRLDRIIRRGTDGKGQGL